MFPLLYDMVLTFWHLNPWAKLKSVTIQMNPLSSTFRDGGQENQNTTRKEKKQMNNLKSYRLSGACNVSRRVYNLRSKRQFRALFKNQPNKLTGPTQGKRVYIIIISFFSHSSTCSLREFLLLEYAASLMSNHRWELLLMAIADVTLTFLRS